MYSSKLPPWTSAVPPKKRSQARARLTGPLIYGEEAIKALRSNQPQSNNRQTFRQDRGVNNNRPTKSIPVNAAAAATPRRTIMERQIRTPTPPANRKYYVAQMTDLESRRPIERSPRESFAEFTRRVNTLTANKLRLDQNLHDSFVELSLGQRPQNSAFDHGPDSGRNSRYTSTATLTAHGLLIPREDTANSDRYRNKKPYETTFALLEARSSGSDSDSFRPSDRYWRNTLLKRKGSKKEQYRGKKIEIPPFTMGERYRGMGSWRENQKPIPQQESSSGLFKSNIIDEGQLVLREASKLLSASTKLRMNEEREDRSPVPSASKHFGYIPLKVKNKNPKVTFHDRIQERREAIKSNGYIPVDPVVEEITEFERILDSHSDPN